MHQCIDVVLRLKCHFCKFYRIKLRLKKKLSFLIHIRKLRNVEVVKAKYILVLFKKSNKIYQLAYENQHHQIDIKNMNTYN